MTPKKVKISTEGFDFRKAASRIWAWMGVLTLIIWAYPVAYRTTRLLLILGVIFTWSGAIFIWWRKRSVSLPLMVIALLVLALVSLPGRPIQTEALGRDYCRGLRMFLGVRYVWGGEGLLGIDCSGLVRQGLIWGQVCRGVRTLNGQLIRDAVSLWWNDCSALALRDGFEGLTREHFRAHSIMESDHGLLQPGDLAITADGVHVMAYLGNRTWIEADPVMLKVMEITLPTDNPWFHVPVIFMRWRCLDPR